MLDLLIRGGTLIDGTGAPGRRADVGAVADRLVAVGQLEGREADRVIDATGCVVCPGFIDTHSHADMALLDGRWMDYRLCQGITTEVIGQDGLGYAPASPAHLAEWRQYLAALNGDLPAVRWDWGSVGQLLRNYRSAPANTVFLVPHGAVRVEVMGWEARPASAAELKAMKGLVAASLREGAAGLSTGLSYVPCAHATTDEMVALCEPVAAAGGVLAIHMRSYITDLMGALEETIEIGRRSGVAVQISHLRMCDPLTWGYAERVIEVLDQARADGVDVTYDIYPYTAGCAPLFAMLPLWAQAGGPGAILDRLEDPHQRQRIADEMEAWPTDWPAFMLSNVPPNELGDFAGSSVAQAAEACQLPVPEFILELMAATQLETAIVADGGNQADNDLMLAHPAAMICSDGVLPGQYPHPRGYGAFPRVLAQVVRERGLLSWEEAIHKMTGASAARHNLWDRGEIKTGKAADLVVLRPDEVADQAVWPEGRRFPVGIPWVVVNGHIVVEEARHVGGHSNHAGGYGRLLSPLG